MINGACIHSYTHSFVCKIYSRSRLYRIANKRPKFTSKQEGVAHSNARRCQNHSPMLTSNTFWYGIPFSMPPPPYHNYHKSTEEKWTTRWKRELGHVVCQAHHKNIFFTGETCGQFYSHSLYPSLPPVIIFSYFIPTIYLTYRLH